MKRFWQLMRGPLAQSVSLQNIRDHQVWAARWNIRGILMVINSGIGSLVLYRFMNTVQVPPEYYAYVVLSPLIFGVSFLGTYNYWAGVHRGIAEQMEHDLGTKGES